MQLKLSNGALPFVCEVPGSVQASGNSCGLLKTSQDPPWSSSQHFYSLPESVCLRQCLYIAETGLDYILQPRLTLN